MIVALPTENVSLMELTDEDILSLSAIKIVNDSGDNGVANNAIKVGNVYAEEKSSIDGEKMPVRFWKVLGVLGKIADIEINSYLVKEVYPDGNNGWLLENAADHHTRFSLTRDDCVFLNVQYQNGIELYPFQMANERFRMPDLDNDNDKRSVSEILSDMNADDLATYPISRIDQSIRTVALRLTGFTSVNDRFVMLPNRSLVSVKNFLSALKVIINIDIPSYFGTSASFAKGTVMSYELVARTKNDAESNAITDANGNMYIEVQTTTKSTITKDGIIGIAPAAVRGLNVNNLFTITYDDGAPHTIRREVPTRTASANRDQEIWDALNKEFAATDKELERINNMINHIWAI